MHVTVAVKTTIRRPNRNMKTRTSTERRKRRRAAVGDPKNRLQSWTKTRHANAANRAVEAVDLVGSLPVPVLAVPNPKPKPKKPAQSQGNTAMREYCTGVSTSNW